MLNIIFIANLASSLFLTGLIWMVQLVHYPIFHRLDITEFTNHIEFHKRSISTIVIPAMLIEIGTSAWLAWSSSSQIILHRAALITVLAIWIVTFFVQVPLHNKLAKERNSDSIQRLVKSNWIRTVLWSLKAILSLLILYNLL